MVREDLLILFDTNIDSGRVGLGLSSLRGRAYRGLGLSLVNRANYLKLEI